MTGFDPIFRWPIRSAQVLGYDEAEGARKPPEDIASDLDFQDTFLETYLSTIGTTAQNAGTVTEYTPTAIGTGVVLGNGSLVGYKVSGGLTFFIAKISFGSTTIAPSAALAISLPEINSVTFTPGATLVYDSSSDTRWGAPAELSTTYAYPLITVSTGALTQVVSGTPVTFSTGDVVVVSGAFNPV